MQFDPAAIQHAQVTTFDEALGAITMGDFTTISLFTLEELSKMVGQIRFGALDFDGSLHSKGSCWSAVAKRMPEHLERADARIRHWYYDSPCFDESTAIDLQNPDWFHSLRHPDNTQVIDGAWVGRDIGWYQEAGLTRDDFMEVAMNLSTREGAPELIQLFEQTAIISFGLEEVIQWWLNRHYLRACIAATRLEFNDEGKIIGHHPNVVASATKRPAAQVFLRGCQAQNESELLVLGDTPVDVHMMFPGSFNVLIVPREETLKALKRFRHRGMAQMWPKITMILHSDSLMPLVELIRRSRR